MEWIDDSPRFVDRGVGGAAKLSSCAFVECGLYVEYKKVVWNAVLALVLSGMAIAAYNI